MHSNEEFQLSEYQIQSCIEEGLLQVDFGLNLDLLDSIVQKTMALYDRGLLEEQVSGVRIQDGWKQVDEIRQLAMHRSILNALSQLFGRKAKPFQTLNFPIGTEQLPHSDTLHFNSIPGGFMAGVWVALEDIDEENGPLIYYPGSHKLKEYSMRSFSLGRGHAFYPKYEQEIQRLIEREQLTPKLGIIKKGEAIIWHANLLHGGAPQINQSRSRHSQVTYCYFEDCKYYTPLYSRFLMKRFRNPIWIPDTPDYVLPARAYMPPTPWLQRFQKTLINGLKKLNPLGK
ncbi:MAG: phytanoyl-CoA dioxygenase family protein [Gammaproteobacteria bacterium]|nr:phytanoyl-CoA dioxygenase family protein [Gammaproteobacteria bacterium]